MFNAFDKESQSKQFYQEAEELLLTELGLKDWQPTEENITEKSFSSSFLTSGRLDAEYYQPKYDQLIEKLKKYNKGCENIRNVLSADIKNGTTPKNIIQEYVKDTPNFVRAEAFNQFLDMDKENFYSISNETYSQYKSIRINKNDVLVSMTGTIGNVAIYSLDEPAIINQNIVKLTCNFSMINPLVLALYIKTVGKDLLVRQQTGNVQPYVNISNFSNLIVPLINQNIQSKIIKLLNNSNNFRHRSQRLLEIAKKGVEKAIENNEEIATKWINEELEKIGVNIE